MPADAPVFCSNLGFLTGDVLSAGFWSDELLAAFAPLVVSGVGSFSGCAWIDLASLLIERALWKRLDEQASDDHEHVSDARLRGPVLLEHVNADFAGRGNVGVKDFGQEVALGWGVGKLAWYDETDAEHAALERSAGGPQHLSLHVCHIMLVERDADALRRRRLQLRELLGQALDHRARQLHGGCRIKRIELPQVGPGASETGVSAACERSASREARRAVARDACAEPLWECVAPAAAATAADAAAGAPTPSVGGLRRHLVWAVASPHLQHSYPPRIQVPPPAALDPAAIRRSTSQAVLSDAVFCAEMSRATAAATVAPVAPRSSHTPPPSHSCCSTITT
eukprot:353350-Chlamydomonas_euryale.AAC.12